MASSIACLEMDSSIAPPGGQRNSSSARNTSDAGWFLLQQWEGSPILSFAKYPRIHVEIDDQPGLPPLGAGECAAGPTAAAVANAGAHARGIRVRHMPITAGRLIKAIHAA